MATPDEAFSQFVELEWEDHVGYTCAELPVGYRCPECRCSTFTRLDVVTHGGDSFRPVRCRRCFTRYAFPVAVPTRRLPSWRGSVARWWRGLARWWREVLRRAPSGSES